MDSRGGGWLAGGCGAVESRSRLPMSDIWISSTDPDHAPTLFSFYLALVRRARPVFLFLSVHLRQ